MGIAYEKDIVAWANEQANFIRSGRFDLLDLEHTLRRLKTWAKANNVS